MKRCYACHTDKPYELFHKNSKTKDGYDTRCKPCKKLNYEKRRDKDPLQTYFVAKRSWCKQRGIEFSLTLEQLKELWTDTCPILGIPISLGAKGKGSHNSAHLDRLDPSVGYTYENVNWISGRANRIKYDASLSELKAIIQWMERATTIPKGSTLQADGSGNGEMA